ncbi:MAG: hypothetical protein DWQ36_06625 [Acidobacteria bacterium]|nr:MAG: hypothetical protein DWQ30_08530 [Acidobacteriota bacterium]REK09526.1 MAG: hypothetical protein DWQ36_06625 [Acidobacteriota bacterium]
MVKLPLGVAFSFSLLLSWGLPVGALGQEPAYDPPRTAEGRPDFSGVWTNASLTRLSRPDDIETLVLDPARAAELSGKHFHNVRAARDLQPSDPDREAPEVVERLPPVGNYNAGWVDPGTDYAVVNGEIRSSWLVEPADGQVPYLPELRERLTAAGELRRTREGPEVMSLGERCVLGFGGTAGPPMLNVLYNNYYRFVQTGDRLMVLIEMVHDARDIPIVADAAAAKEARQASSRGRVPRWLGDSVAHWDGEVLVIETTDFHPERASYGPLYYSEQARVEERLTRVSDDAIHYAFRIDDPLHYSEPMRGEMTLRAVLGPVFEYACHEGNYAMPGILKGARLEEREAAGVE